jgi:hypothetical protein
MIISAHDVSSLRLMMAAAPRDMNVKAEEKFWN